MKTIGFVGLGTMGRPMAHNLLKAGFELVFYARREEVAREFQQAGARRASSVADVTQAADAVITIVTADAEVETVALGPLGVAEAAAPGKTLIDMSTISPDTIRRVAAKLQPSGMTTVDAPVSGGPGGAKAGTLTIMAGGDTADVDRCRPIFAALGKNIYHCGPLGAGQTIKIINQMMAGGIMGLVGEAFALANAAGADLPTMLQVIGASSGNSTMFQSRAEKYVLANDYPPTFTTALMRKDVGLALDMGRRLNVPLPVAAAAFQQYTAAMNLGHAGDDFASVAKVSQFRAGAG